MHIYDSVHDVTRKFRPRACHADLGVECGAFQNYCTPKVLSRLKRCRRSSAIFWRHLGDSAINHFEMRHVLRPDLRDRSPQKSHCGALVAQVRVLNAALSIASPYTIANNDLLGIVEPRDASRVSMLGFFHAIHQVMRSMMITGFAICLCSCWRI